jgi:carbamate kinase
MMTAVVAIGGNAISRAQEEATLENQMRHLRETCAHLARMIAAGYDMVLTHGNGPQVGNILLQNELARDDIPPMPLDVCVAESQGLLGYMIQQALTEQLDRLGLNKVVTCIVTRVLVDEDDPAFECPTKPIGLYYTAEEAEQIKQKERCTFIEDVKRGGYRRVVPSPRPVKIVECSAIRRLVFGGEQQAEVVIASGGGGIPVIRRDGHYEGVEAVIDKDLAAARLALDIEEKLFIMLTDADRVYLDFTSANPRPLDRTDVAALETYLSEGQFPAGSMGPKIEAAIQFLKGGGGRVIITSPERLDAALEGRAGTHITR